jgi:hypothetical protein
MVLAGQFKRACAVGLVSAAIAAFTFKVPDGAKKVGFDGLSAIDEVPPGLIRKNAMSRATPAGLL